MTRITHLSSFYFHDILQSVTKLHSVKSRIKSLSSRLPNTGGRSQGLIIAPRKGHLIRRLYRHIDFKRHTFPEHKSLILQIVYDPNRSANLCLTCYPSGIFSYILHPAKLNPGEFIINQTTQPAIPGDSATLAHIPSGRLIHNIQGKFIRSAGCSAILVRQDQDQSLVKLKSGELRFFHASLIASLGSIGNENHFLRDITKAGTSRLLGHRPRTRPSSMNPVDHPMGGRTRGGAQPMNAKGIITLHRKTVKTHNPSILYTKRQLKFIRS